ncbi:phosphatase PAP2 family protein [Nocardia noduli]|uniref:phosphatase PAP2 family protein n=1 Tax=Nocardia noduli TaxID=2815722 RepID=UPI001C239921|nr:phosphatase PAP2 family protein [Nocardia noduli]
MTGLSTEFTRTAVSEEDYPHGTRRVVRVAVRYAYLIALVAAVLTGLIPGGRLTEVAWILTGIIAFSIDRPWRDHLRVVVDWLPLVAVLLVYDFTRDLADTVGMPLRMHELVTVERWFFDGALPTVWLQQHLAEDGQPWWTPIIGIVYTTHFIVPWAVAAIFYLYSRPMWARYMRRILVLSYLALVTYILVPAAPPWYASREGAIDEEVQRISGFGLGMVSPDVSAKWLEEQGNYVAALPSLHTAFAVLVTVTLWPLVRRWWLRVPLALFPFAMAFTLVYGGEHYVIDVLLGYLYVGITIVVVRMWERYRAGRAPVGEDDGAVVEESRVGADA